MAFAVRSILRPGRSTFSLGTAAFSSSAPSSSRRQVLVQLLEEVEGLGFPPDKVLVNPGRARNQLIPSGQARFVPWKRPSERIAERSEPPPAPEPSSYETSTPTFEPTPIEPTTPEILSALQSLPISITFPHRTISPKSTTIHGSVTLADVAKRLEDEFGIPSSAVDVFWRNEDDQSRMKELGRWELEVAPKAGEEAVNIGVEVIRIAE